MNYQHVVCFLCGLFFNQLDIIPISIGIGVGYTICECKQQGTLPTMIVLQKSIMQVYNTYVGIPNNE